MLLLGAVLANIPDLDFFFVWVVPLGVEWHRSFTHSIFFALAATVFVFAGTGLSRVRAVLAGGAALLSHGLLDYLTTRRGGGVELLYPFSDERLKSGIISVSEFERGFYFMEIIKSGLIELLIFTPIFLAVLWIRGYLPYTASVKGDIE
jgi:membrane-bound metal-dependent hydrolase YbcI (DUF457 family)